MASISDQELVEKLTKARQNLLLQLSLSTSPDHLLPLLQEILILLAKVDQLPPKPLHEALSPLNKALLIPDFIHHQDLDVRAGVAVCISEILGISAPHCPYDDDKMKDIFQLIVSCFKNLWWDKSTSSHGKIVRILETMAVYKYYVIMLDLELSQTIGDMFLYFLHSLRGNEASLFAHMEAIMTNIFEESEDVSVDLINPLLSTLRKNNQDVGPTAVRLAEEVIKKCADKLGPLLTKVVSSSATSFDHYSEVIASVCHVKDCSGENISRNSPDDQLGLGVQISTHGSSDMERMNKGAGASSEASIEDVKLNSPPESNLKVSCPETGLTSIDETAQPKSKTQISKPCRESEDENTKCESSPKKLGKESCNDSAKLSDITEDVNGAKATSHLLQDNQSTTKSNDIKLMMIKTPGSVGIGYVKCDWETAFEPPYLHRC